MTDDEIVFWLDTGHGSKQPIGRRQDHSLWNALATEVGDQIEVWTFDAEDPNPIRLVVKDEDGHAVEAWLSPDDGRRLSAMLASVHTALIGGTTTEARS